MLSTPKMVPITKGGHSLLWNGSRFTLNRKMAMSTGSTAKDLPSNNHNSWGPVTATNGHNHPMNLTELRVEQISNMVGRPLCTENLELSPARGSDNQQSFGGMAQPPKVSSEKSTPQPLWVRRDSSERAGCDKSHNPTIGRRRQATSLEKEGCSAWREHKKTHWWFCGRKQNFV